MNAYRTVTKGTSALTVCRSKFYGFVCGIESEDDALNLLADLKKTYPDATHICYAYITDIAGNQGRFSDAGEPSGTAGVPMLNLLKAYAYRKICSAVVRYFGGVKLGTGGLAKAYADTLKLALDAAKPVEKVLCERVKIALSFADYRRAERLLKDPRIKTERTEYSENVTITVAAQKDSGANIIETINALTCGAAETELLNEAYVEF